MAVQFWKRSGYFLKNLWGLCKTPVCPCPPPPPPMSHTCCAGYEEDFPESINLTPQGILINEVTFAAQNQWCPSHLDADDLTTFINNAVVLDHWYDNEVSHTCYWRHEEESADWYEGWWSIWRKSWWYNINEAGDRELYFALSHFLLTGPGGGLTFGYWMGYGWASPGNIEPPNSCDSVYWGGCSGLPDLVNWGQTTDLIDFTNGIYPIW